MKFWLMTYLCISMQMETLANYFGLGKLTHRQVDEYKLFSPMIVVAIYVAVR